MQELESEVLRLSKAKTVSTPLRDVVTLPQGELDEDQAQGKQGLSGLQTQAEADPDTIHAAVHDRTRVQLLLDDERKQRHKVERVTTDFQRRASRHSSLVDSVRSSLHADLRHAYETCLKMLSSEVSGRNRDCGAVYHSEVVPQLWVFGSTTQQAVYSILSSLNQSLEDLRRDDVPADAQ